MEGKMKKLLVAYATKAGSTEEVARAVAKVFEERGWIVDARNVAEVASLGGYSAAVVGAPINSMRWLPAAAAFVAANAAALSAIPTALFYLSYVQFADGRESWKRSIKKGMDALADSVKARAVGAFGGKVEGPMPPPARFIFGTRKDAPPDLRDWDAIRAWAAEIEPLLGA